MTLIGIHWLSEAAFHNYFLHFSRPLFGFHYFCVFLMLFHAASFTVGFVSVHGLDLLDLSIQLVVLKFEVQQIWFVVIILSHKIDVNVDIKWNLLHSFLRRFILTIGDADYSDISRVGFNFSAFNMPCDTPWKVLQHRDMLNTCYYSDIWYGLINFLYYPESIFTRTMQFIDNIIYCVEHNVNDGLVVCNFFHLNSVHCFCVLKLW